ncbi:MAG: hypothetical protein WDZ41_04445 [Candidatus Babeliales bacterium]
MSTVLKRIFFCFIIGSIGIVMAENFVIPKKKRSTSALKEEIGSLLGQAIQECADCIGLTNAVERYSITTFYDLYENKQEQKLVKADRQQLEAYKQKLQLLMQEIDLFKQRCKNAFTDLKNTIH